MASHHDKEIEQRAARCVCKYCGHPLTVKFILFNKYGGQGRELYCDNCSRIEYGVEPEIYHLAARFVDELEFNYFLDMEENEAARQLNIAKAAEIMTWTFRQAGQLSKDGLNDALRQGLHDQEGRE